MKKSLCSKYIIVISLFLAMVSCGKKGNLSLEFPDKFEGKNVELMNYMDSTVIATSVVKDGKATFITTESDTLKFPIITQILVDGRVNSYYILESGKAVVTDSTSVAKGTPLNDKFRSMLARLDSVDNLDDMSLYVDFVEKEYNANRDNVLSDFLGVEWLKFADPARTDSFLNVAGDRFRNLNRVKYYEGFAKRRLSTAPGMKYSDLRGEGPHGGMLRMSQLMIPGHYTLVDFWASWCPYCIKELPALKALYADYKGKGLDIIGVAVRDIPADTRQIVKKQQIGWPVIYNTQKEPYDIYGFSGIPHHILIGPDGTIISRGENVEQIRERLSNLLP